MIVLTILSSHHCQGCDHIIIKDATTLSISIDNVIIIIRFVAVDCHMTIIIIIILTSYHPHHCIILIIISSSLYHPHHCIILSSYHYHPHQRVIHINIIISWRHHLLQQERRLDSKEREPAGSLVVMEDMVVVATRGTLINNQLILAPLLLCPFIMIDQHQGRRPRLILQRS